MAENNPQEPAAGPSNVLQAYDSDQLRNLLETLRLRDSETGAPDPADEPPNWLEQELGSAPLWSPTQDYRTSSWCMNCLLTTSLLNGGYAKRGTPEFKYRYLREVSTLYHIDPTRMPDDFTPKDIMTEAIGGCPLCSLAIGSSWLRGDLPFDTARWSKNPLWRKRAQYLLFNMYRPDRQPVEGGINNHPLLQIIFGTNMTTQLYPEADMSEFWGAIHLWEPQELKKWYLENSYPYDSYDTLGRPPYPPLTPSTGDPEALEIGQWWLKRCLKEHKSCAEAGKQVEADHTPARLLYVGKMEKPNTVKLVTNDAVVPEYVCLSYCWGKKPFIQLTSKTLDAFQQSIDIDALPATLKDAVAVTQKLGFEYIWIDCLCIIQDSKEDWLNESAKMGSVYRRAALTVAALGAIDCHQGLFTARNPTCFLDTPIGKGGLVLTNRAPKVTPGFRREFEVLGPAASALQTRAWCVQEQLLSPRTLFFGASGLSWQCLECEADEGYPIGTKGQFENLKAVITKSVAERSLDLRKVWREILERYTGCHLTYASDKLVAISGIADLITRASSEEYILGLWKNDIFRDLLWHSQYDKWTEMGKLKRLDNRVPTFSWASVGQPIYYFKYDSPKTMHLDAKSISIEPKSAKDGPEYKLRLTTQLREVVLLPPKYSKCGSPTFVLASDMPFAEPPPWNDPQIPNDVIVRSQEHIQFDWTIDFNLTEDVDTSHMKGFSYTWTPDIPLDGSITRAWYMCVARFDDRDPLGTVGLIVTPVDEARTAWKRIGFMAHSGFYSSFKEAGLRVTVQNTATNEIDWEETGKHRAPNPFLLDPDEECVEAVLV